MIRIASRSKPPFRTWQQVFLAMLTTIVTYARVAFRYLKPEARSEAIQEVCVQPLKAFVRLVELGKADIAYASPLARYGVAQTRDHRKVGGHLNVRDVMSPYCQVNKGVVQRLDKFDEQENASQEAVIVDT